MKRCVELQYQKRYETLHASLFSGEELPCQFGRSLPLLQGLSFL